MCYFKQGEKPKHSYYLVKGCIRQYAYDEKGKEATVDFYLEEDPVNMFSFTDDEGLSLYSLACLEDCYLVECQDINEEDFAYAEETEQMKFSMFKRQYSDMQQHYTVFKLKEPEERYRQLCLQRPEPIGRISQVYLSSYLGVTPGTFSRIKRRVQD